MLLGRAFLCFCLPVIAVALHSRASYPLDKVAFIGRWFEKRCSWGLASFTLTFQGSSSVVALLADSGSKRYTCQIDGGADQEVLLQGGRLAIAVGLTTGVHTIRCGRNTEASFGETVLQDLLLDAGAVPLEPSGRHGLRMEVVGDSIATGAAALAAPQSGEHGNESTEDVFQSFSRLTADAWNTTDWRVVAKSGVGVLPNEFGPGMKDLFPCREFSFRCPAQWDFRQWQADVVLVYLGTNDFHLGNPTTAAFEQGYIDLLALLRWKYPRALILCIVPLMYACHADEKWQRMLQGITESVRSFQDARLRLHSTGTRDAPWLDCEKDFTDYIHPTTEGHRKFAQRLIPQLSRDLLQRM